LKVEIYLIKTSGRIKINPEVLVVENSFNREIRCIIKSILAASCRLNEECLLNLSVTLLHQDPAVKARVSVRVFPFKVRLVIIDGDCLIFSLLNLIVSNRLDLIIELRMMWDLLGDLIIIDRSDQRRFLRSHMLLIFVNLGIVLIIVIRHFDREWAFH
jgi:hypothetical protein